MWVHFKNQDLSLKQAYIDNNNARKHTFTYKDVLRPAIDSEDSLKHDSLPSLDSAVDEDLEFKLNDVHTLSDKIGTFLPTYVKVLPPNWRNISHHLNRRSMDCRLRFISLVLGRDLDRVPDVWFEGEVVYLITRPTSSFSSVFFIVHFFAGSISSFS